MIQSYQLESEPGPLVGLGLRITLHRRGKLVSKLTIKEKISLAVTKIVKILRLKGDDSNPELILHFKDAICFTPTAKVTWRLLGRQIAKELGYTQSSTRQYDSSIQIDLVYYHIKEEMVEFLHLQSLVDDWENGTLQVTWDLMSDLANQQQLPTAGEQLLII